MRFPEDQVRVMGRDVIDITCRIVNGNEQDREGAKFEAGRR